jgi:hypothetical protein
VRRLILRGSVLALFTVVVATFGRAGEDTPKAAETRKLLQQKVTVDYSEMTLSEAVDDLKSQVKGLTFKLDTAGGVSKNVKMTYKGEDKTVAEVLDGMFKKNGYGYIVISKKGNAYDGIVQIKQGKERGYAQGEDAGAADKDKAAGKATAKTKPAKTKDVSKEKPASEEKPGDDADKTEREAATKLQFAKTLAEDGKKVRAKERLEELIAKYPDTKAAKEAKALLKKLED